MSERRSERAENRSRLESAYCSGGEFACDHDEQTIVLIRATQEIVYRSGAYENAAFLLAF
jgi:hypothetical protein